MGAIGDLAQIGFQIAAYNQAKKQAQKMEDQGNSWMIESRIDKERLGERPKMEIPQAQTDYIDLMKLGTRRGLPGEEIMKEDLRQEGATTRGAFANLSGADAAAGLLGESAQRMRGLRAIGLEAARYGERQETAYAGAVQSNAPWQQEMWQQNQMYPWEIGQNRAQGYENAGQGMFMQGSDMGAAGWIQGANMMQQNIHGYQMDPNNSWWGQGGGGGGGQGGGQGYPYSYNFSTQIGNMGQQQFAQDPRTANLGSDPYSNR